MEYEKINDLLDNTLNQLSKFRANNWIETNDHSREVYSFNSDIRFKTLNLKSRLCNYNDVYILVKGTITIAAAEAAAAARKADERDKGVTFKNCVSFNNGKSEINNTKKDNARDMYTVMAMYNIVEYSDNYSKTPGSLWKYYKDEPNNNLTDFQSFKSKIKITGKTPDDDNTKDVEITAPLKYLSNLWRALEITLINCEVNLILIWSSACVIPNSTSAGRFTITDTNFINSRKCKIISTIKNWF